MSSTSQNFTGKVVLITGASSGIGAITAVHFAKLGARLVITGRNLENLKKVGEQCLEEGRPIPHLIQADLTKQEDIKTIIDSTIEHFGKLDVLVNNAGIFEIGSLAQADLEQFDRLFTTNLKAVFELSKLASPHLTASKGNIVNVSSLAGIRAFPRAINYCMTKAALNQFTQCLALELAPNVRVNSVNPGFIETNIMKNAGIPEDQIQLIAEKHKTVTPLGRNGISEEVSDAIVFLASEQAAYITGQILSVDGGRFLTCQR